MSRERTSTLGICQADASSMAREVSRLISSVNTASFMEALGGKPCAAAGGGWIRVWPLI